MRNIIRKAENKMETKGDDIVVEKKIGEIIEGEIHSIEWLNGKPFSVIVYQDEKNTWATTYDIDYCKRDNQLYYYWSGGGHATVNEGREGLDIMPDIKTFDDLVRHFGMIEDETQWCSQCGDILPIENLCDHIYWDEEEGWWKEKGIKEE